MKKIKQITILLLSAILILSFAACSDSHEEEQTSKTTETTTLETTSEETTQSTDAADYIPGPQEAYELLKPFYAEHGYDFDSWKIYTNTDEQYQLIGPNENQVVIINYGMLIIRTGEKDTTLLSYESGRFKSIIMNFKNGVDPYDLCDLILTNCPDDYKLSGEYLKNHINEVINNGTAKWEKNGLEYSIMTSAYETDASSFMIFNLDFRL